MRVVLVSTSPRRRELLKRLVPVFDVVEPAGEGEVRREGHPAGVVLSLAELKLNSVDRKGSGIYLAADTVVEVDGRILGKPSGFEEAFGMLKGLSGRWHRVYTGVVVERDGRRISGVECTKVKFASLSDDEIGWYLETYRPFDKAGAYGIQDGAEIFVEKIVGSYSNVVGLPLALVYRFLKRLGFKNCVWKRLADVARVVRSKNAGPFEVTFDIMFDDEESYFYFKRGSFLDKEAFARLYGIEVEDVLVFEYFDQALALKITIKRDVPSGSVGDEDVYAAQMHLPLMNFMIPWKVYG